MTQQGIFAQLRAALVSLGILHAGGAALTFVLGILLARLLGADGYGTYALAIAITTMAGIVAECGFPILVIRDYGAAQARGSWSESRGLVIFADRLILGLSALLCAGVAIVAASMGSRASSPLLPALYFALPLIPLAALAKLRGGALLAMHRTAAGQAPTLLLRPAMAALMLACAALAGLAIGPEHALLFQVVAAAGACWLLIRSYRLAVVRHADGGAPEYRRRAWLASSIPMGLSEGLRLAQGQIGLLVLGAFSTLSAAGIYRVADAAAAVCMLPLTIVAVASSPVLSRAWAGQDRAALDRILAGLVLLQVAVVGLLSLPLLLFGEALLAFAFGAEFGQAALPLSLLLGGSILAAALGPAPAVANMVGLERVKTIATAAAVVAQLLVTIALVPRLGAAGAAIGVGVGQLLWSGAIAIALRRMTGLDTTLLGWRHARLGTLLRRGGSAC